MNIKKQTLSFIKKEDIRQKLLNFIKKSNKEKLFHIDVYALADSWNIKRETLLGYFVEGVFNSLFSIEWNYHCPSCGSIAKETLNIHDSTSEDYCATCQVGFKNTIDQNIDVFFSIHKNIFKLSSSYKKKWISNMQEDVIAKHKYEWKTDTTIYGADLIRSNIFRDLFGTDVLLAEQSLEIEHVTVLFTDITGSTQLYTDLGDSKAFSLVLNHFKILFDIIIKNNGVPIKTIGDAVMGIFTNNKDSLNAALESQKVFKIFYANKPEKEQIKVKIGLHSGTAIIVTLNGKLDYFGTTVNLAARIKSAAKVNEVVFSKGFMSSKENIELLKLYNNKLTKSVHSFKGLNEKHEVYHITV